MTAIIYPNVNKMSLRNLFIKFCVLFLFLYCIPLQGQIKQKRKNKKTVPTEDVYMDTMDIFPVNKITDYKGSYPKYFNLLHTRLNITPSFSDRTISGTATLKLHAHFYDQAELVLDAKGMEFDTILLSLDQFVSPARYAYDGIKLKIELPHSVSRKDTFEVKIQYTARPHELNDLQKKSGQGAHFINSYQTNPYRSTILWTQGETEMSSCWFPTIDASNQRTTQEIFVTVPDSMTTISNGTLIEKKQHDNGTRTDYWRQMQTHTPYLFALVVGPYLEYEDKWRDKPVSYYALAPYIKDVQAVFGRTPEMMEYFSNLFYYDFPWDNYKQVTVYDFTAGAMENTTLSVFHDGMMCNHQDLLDKHWGEDPIIAHELVHQWFGDLVTCESWSQLTLNESFANYGEFLWLEKWKGLADAEAHWYNRFNSYMHEYTYLKTEPIVQHYYVYPKEIFDRHRYDKGGIVLNLLRTYLGDEAFFESLGEYLKANEYQSAEVHQLRLAFEKVTGQDLNWFFNQWWYSPGHPVVEISQKYDDVHKEVVLGFYQKQDLHPNATIPYHKIILNVDFIYADTTVRHKITLTNKQERIKISSETPPLAINFDPGKIQVWEAEYTCSPNELSIIYNRSERVLDKVFVINQLKKSGDFKTAGQLLLPHIEDQHWFVRDKIIEIATSFDSTDQKILSQKLKVLLTSELAFERTSALFGLQRLKEPDIIQIARDILPLDSSFQVKSTCLRILLDTLGAEAYPYAQPWMSIQNPHLETAISKILAAQPLPEDMGYFERTILTILHHYSRDIFVPFEKYLLAMDSENFKKGLDIVKNVIQNEFPNNRVIQAKELLERLKKMEIGSDGMTESKKTMVLNMME